MSKKLAALLVALIVYAIASVPAQAGDLDSFEGQRGTIRIAGGTAHIPVMKEAARQIMSRNPDIQISIAGGGSGLGIRQVGEGLVDIGNAGRRPSKNEIAKYNLKLFQWAVDGVGAVVHPDNPVKSLTSEQMRDVFAGKIRNWKELGGSDGKINIYTRDAASGTRKVFWKKGLDKGPITDKANVVASNGAMKSVISTDPMGIGYVSVGHIDQTVAPIALDGVVPSLENVKNGKYTIARGLYSLTRGEPAGLKKIFIDFLFSPTGQRIVADKGFIPVR